MAKHPLRIFSGSCYPELAYEIASNLHIPLGLSTTTHLPDFRNPCQDR